MDLTSTEAHDLIQDLKIWLDDGSGDIPLTLEFWPSTGTGVADTELSTASCQAPFDLELSNRTVTIDPLLAP